LCDPVTIISAFSALSGIAGSLFGNKTPKAKVPAPPAPTSKTPGATVKVGTDDDASDVSIGNAASFTEKRKQGKALGGLGRGGLTI
jgi:hypothetical protein